MVPYDKNDVRKTLLGHMGQVAEDLKKLASAKDSKAAVFPGSWANEEGVVTAYAGYHPRNGGYGNGIEVLMSLVPTDNEVHFMADIYGSDGRRIRRISRAPLQSKSGDELKAEVNSLCQWAGEQVRQHLKEGLLEF